MFEAKPPQMPLPTGTTAPFAEGDSLRELTWRDLRSRLEAARDLRVTLARTTPADPASFDAPAARHVAALEHGKEVVNPIDLANGKGIDGTTTASHDGGDYRPLRI